MCYALVAAALLSTAPLLHTMTKLAFYSSILMRDDLENGGEDPRVPQQRRLGGFHHPTRRWMLSYSSIVVAFVVGVLIGAVAMHKHDYMQHSPPEPLEAFVNVTIDPTQVVNLASGVDHGFACVTLDFWPADKCDYGHCSWINASVLTLPLSGYPETITHRRLRKALEAMSKIQVESSPYSFASKSPVILRLGGSTADLIRYDVNSTDGPWNCTDFVKDENSPIGYKFDAYSGPCMPMKRWEEILSLCRDGNCQLVFGINALFGRKKVMCPNKTTSFENEPTSEWDSSNAEAFLRYTKVNGHSVWGYEFGNELAGKRGIQMRLSVDEYVAGFCQLKSVIDRLWGTVNVNTRPRLLAPDSGFLPDWYTEFLTKSHAAGCAPDVVNWHQYILGAGVDPSVDERSLNPDLLDTQKWHGDHVKNTIRSIDGIQPEIWMGEAGGAYNSGRPGVTDTFHSSFWFLDSLGILAARGHQAFCRQTLIGGNYGLLDRQTYEPNPDYYAFLLFQKLMGTKVLKTYDPVGEHSRYIRLYAHCSRRADTDGSVTILVLNLSGHTTFYVKVSALQGGTFGFHTLGHTSWVISAESIGSNKVYLNGGPALHTKNNGDIPILKGHYSNGETTQYYSVEPHTYAFVRLDGTSAAPVCQRDLL